MNQWRKKHLRKFGKWLIGEEEKYPPSKGYCRLYDRMHIISEDMIKEYGVKDPIHNAIMSLPNYFDSENKSKCKVVNKVIPVYRENTWELTVGYYIREPGCYRLELRDGIYWESCASGFPNHHQNRLLKEYKTEKREKHAERLRKKRKKELDERVERYKKLCFAEQKSEAVKKDKRTDMFFQALAISGSMGKEKMNHY